MRQVSQTGDDSIFATHASLSLSCCISHELLEKTYKLHRDPVIFLHPFLGGWGKYLPSWESTPPPQHRVFLKKKVFQCKFALCTCLHPPNICLYPPPQFQIARNNPAETECSLYFILEYLVSACNAVIAHLSPSFCIVEICQVANLASTRPTIIKWHNTNIHIYITWKLYTNLASTSLIKVA